MSSAEEALKHVRIIATRRYLEAIGFDGDATLETLEEILAGVIPALRGQVERYNKAAAAQNELQARLEANRWKKEE